ncbi:DUF5686 family protein [Ferruginibacter yonginensis]|uniref:DUF5686 family protein n=1 Tax=Ferruginibacter yonginensis TaxID=1310416 RepID=A0ABV8QSH5_9BACT
MRIHKYLFLLLFFVYPLMASAQLVTLSGMVQDAFTKEPVNFASVSFALAGNGKVADSAGNFSFYLKPGTVDTLMVSYVGYQTFKEPISMLNGDAQIIISLQRGTSNEVVIKSKINKGLFLWRKIMSKKKLYNRYNQTNFAYEAYNKLEIDFKNFKADKLKKNFILKPFSFIFDNIDSTSEKEPFLPFFLVESISDYAFQKNTKKYFENIKATNIKGINNESISKMLGVMNQNVNVYGNYINVMDKDFVSPFNDRADDFYNFSVPDTQILNGKKILHFVFRPKHPGQNTFEGDAMVFAGTYQIQKIGLNLGKDANVNFVDRVGIFQEFIPINDSVYFISRDKFFADFKILGKQSLTMIGRKTTSYKNIIINSDSITNLFKAQNIEELVTTAKGVNNFSDSSWQNFRHDSLSTNEKAIYATVDKLNSMPTFKKFQKRIKFLTTGYTNDGNVVFGPWFNWVSANQYEGTRLRFDLGTNPGFHKKIYIHTYLAYGTKDKQFKGQAEAYWNITKTPNRFRLHASYSKDIDNGISQIGEVSQDNVFSLAIRKPNITRKFIRLQDVRFEILKDFGKGFSTELFFIHKQYDPLLNLPALKTVNGTTLINFETALKLRFAYLEQYLEGDYFRYSLGSKYPIIEATFSKGMAGVGNSAYNYHRVSVNIKDNIKISPYGSVSYKIFAGKVDGTLPYVFLENHPGNDIYYYNGNAFNLMTRFEYLSDRYAGLNVEHHVGAGLFRFTNITRKLKWRQFWTGKALWGSLSNDNLKLNNTVGTFKTLNNKTYMELGTGIDNIFKVFRVDFIWRLTANERPIQKVSHFGVFGSFQLQF